MDYGKVDPGMEECECGDCRSVHGGGGCYKGACKCLGFTLTKTPTYCPICTGAIRDLRGAGFGGEALRRDRVCYAFDGGYCCNQPMSEPGA